MKDQTIKTLKSYVTRARNEFKANLKKVEVLEKDNKDFNYTKAYNLIGRVVRELSNNPGYVIYGILEMRVWNNLYIGDIETHQYFYNDVVALTGFRYLLKLVKESDNAYVENFVNTHSYEEMVAHFKQWMHCKGIVRGIEMLAGKTTPEDEYYSRWCKMDRLEIYKTQGIDIKGQWETRAPII